MKEKIVLGLSGGVDSAVAAALLRRDYEVHCLFLDAGSGTGREDARATACFLHLPFAVSSIREPLEECVCTPFAADYVNGKTPLPCARCNPLVKFPALMREADRIGARLVATGHYARTATEEGTLRPLLLKGKPENDQSYLLSRLRPRQIERIRFPLGGYRKQEVRGLAKEMGLPVYAKPDSMEICFIPEGDYAGWLFVARFPRRGILWIPAAAFWAGIGASITIRWGSGGACGFPPAGGCMSVKSIRKPTGSPFRKGTGFWFGRRFAAPPTGFPGTAFLSPRKEP